VKSGHSWAATKLPFTRDANAPRSEPRLKTGAQTQEKCRRSHRAVPGHVGLTLNLAPAINVARCLQLSRAQRAAASPSSIDQAEGIGVWLGGMINSVARRSPGDGGVGHRAASTTKMVYVTPVG
jgi:hypothetical protein